MNLEPLESRIAPAAVFTFTDVDGDKVTITTSKGTNDQLDAIFNAAQIVPAGTLGGLQLKVWARACPQPTPTASRCTSSKSKTNGAADVRRLTPAAAN